MSRNSNGVYTLPSSVNPVVPGTIIESNWANTTMDDLATALTQSISSTGVTTPTANLPMGGFVHTGAGNPTARQSYTTLGYVQDGTATRITWVNGQVDPNALVGTIPGNNTNYQEGTIVSFFYTFSGASENTGDVTIQYISGSPKSLYTSGGAQLQQGDLTVDGFYYAYYNNDKFTLISEVPSSANSGLVVQSSITGWTRPSSQVYPAITTQNAGTTFTVPAGTGVITAPGSGGTETSISWLAQSGLSPIGIYPNSVYRYTTVAIDETGTVVQIAGDASPANYRNLIVIGRLNHPNGTSVSGVTMNPPIFGDDGYSSRDVQFLFTNSLVSGGVITAGGGAMQFNISGGSSYVPGSASVTVDSPNFGGTIGFNAGSTFYPVYMNSDTSVAGITDLPVASYDVLGVLTALTGAAYCSIGRLYQSGPWVYYEYGQTEYATVSDALLKLRVDQTTHIKSPQVVGMTFLGYALFRKDCANLGTAIAAGTGFFIGMGDQPWSFTSPGMFADAVSDGYYYGRQDGGWQRVVAAADATITSELLIEEMNNPRVHMIVEDYGGYTQNWAGLHIQRRPLSHTDPAYDWVRVQANFVANTVTFSGYDPTNGSIYWTTTWNLASGIWNFPQGITVAGGVAGGNVTGPADSVDNEIALFSSTSGKIIKRGSVVGTAAYIPKQTSTTDTTAGSALIFGAFGLGKDGASSALMIPKGTTVEAPAAAAGLIRYDTTLGYNMQAVGGTPAWVKVPVPADMPTKGYIYGLNTASATFGTTNNSISVTAGVCGDSTGAYLITVTDTVKKLDATWAAGSPAGGMPTASPYTTGWWRVFALGNSTNTAGTIGFDDDSSAANIRANAAVKTALGVSLAADIRYRQIAWVNLVTIGGTCTPYSQYGSSFMLDYPIATSTPVSTASLVNTGIAITVTAPPSTLVDVSQAQDAAGGVNNQTAYSLATNIGSVAVPSVSSFTSACLPTNASRSSSTSKVITSASSTIRIVMSNSSNTGCSLITQITGWTDTRGQ